MKPKILIFAGYGLNCDEETKYAFDTAGGSADIIHINDVIFRKNIIAKYQILVFQGGFAYGDDTGAGNAYAMKVKNHLWKNLTDFIKKDTLIIGICNGFQILVNLGLLPALDGHYGEREVALINNDNARYTVRFTDLASENKSPWIAGIDKISMPIAHGEGKLFAEPEVLKKLKNNKQIALRYIKGETCRYLNLPANPNGSIDDIAGITDPTGKILGLMPHPERAIFLNQIPDFPYLKEIYNREGRRLPSEGPGMKIFRNAIEYFL